MTMRVDENWFRDYCKRTGQEHLLEQLDRKRSEDAIPKRSKYGNRRTTVDGKTFDSQHEAMVYLSLKAAVEEGKYLAVTCQVTFVLPGGVKYKADFVTLNRDGSFTVYDAKSPATQKDKVYRIKRRQMRECLGIEIQEV